VSILCFDTSAIIKLIREERESGALRLWLAEASRRAAIPVCSALALTEVPRALRRLVPGADLPDFVAVLDRFNPNAHRGDVAVADPSVFGQRKVF